MQYKEITGIFKLQLPYNLMVYKKFEQKLKQFYIGNLKRVKQLETKYSNDR